MNGLILTGGESRRMGKDKARIQYHGKAHYLYLAELLQNICDKVYISANNSQKLSTDFPVIYDNPSIKGPFTGILAALQQDNHAYLIVACDMPSIDFSVLKNLTEQRNPNKLASVFRHSNGQIEPLISIWEKKSRKHVESFIKNGGQSPRKFLIQNDKNINWILPNNPQKLLNINTEKEYQSFLDNQ